jgi:hypothetical protein
MPDYTVVASRSWRLSANPTAAPESLLKTLGQESLKANVSASLNVLREVRPDEVELVELASG